MNTSRLRVPAVWFNLQSMLDVLAFAYHHRVSRVPVLAAASCLSAPSLPSVRLISVSFACHPPCPAPRSSLRREDQRGGAAGCDRSRPRPGGAASHRGISDSGEISFRWLLVHSSYHSGGASIREPSLPRCSAELRQRQRLDVIIWALGPIAAARTRRQPLSVLSSHYQPATALVDE